MSDTERDHAHDDNSMFGLGGFGGDILFSDPTATTYDTPPDVGATADISSVDASAMTSVLTSAEGTNVFSGELADHLAADGAPLASQPPWPRQGTPEPAPPVAGPTPVLPPSGPPAPAPAPPPQQRQGANPYAQQRVSARSPRQAQRSVGLSKGPRKIVSLLVGLWLLGTFGSMISGFFGGRGEDASPVSPPSISADPLPEPSSEPAETQFPPIDESALPPAPDGPIGEPTGFDSAGHPEHTGMRYLPDKMPANPELIRIQILRTTVPIRLETFVGASLDSSKDTEPGSIYGWEADPDDQDVITLRLRSSDTSVLLGCGIFADRVLVGSGSGRNGILDCVYDPASLKP